MILNTWETPKDIETIADNSKNVKLFNVLGLDHAAEAILKAKNLKDPEIWSDLIQVYQGHPQWLKWVVMMISDLGEENIRESWQFEKLLLPEELKLSLETQLSRLSDLEQQILTYLSQETYPTPLPQLVSQFNNSPTNTFNTVQSLKKRGLIETSDLLAIKPIIKQYLHNSNASF